MTLLKLISMYVNESIKDCSRGFTTDFGIGKMVSTHVSFHLGITTVTIKALNKTEDFKIRDSKAIIKFIYQNLKQEIMKKHFENLGAAILFMFAMSLITIILFEILK